MIVTRVEMFILSSTGTVIDARRVEALQPGLSVIQKAGADLVLPDGTALSFVPVNISFTGSFESVTAVSRKSLFSQVIQGGFQMQSSATVIEIFKASLLETYTGLFPNYHIYWSSSILHRVPLKTQHTIFCFLTRLHQVVPGHCYELVELR